MNAPVPGLHAAMPSQTPCLVSLANVTVGYDRHPAVHHLQLQINAGDMLAVVGPNGAGKSTFLKLLIGERLSLLDGEVQLPDERRSRVAYLPQISQTDRQFPITVQDLVASGLWHRCGAFGARGPAGWPKHSTRWGCGATPGGSSVHCRAENSSGCALPS